MSATEFDDVNKSKAQPADLAGAGSLEKIRDILFGAQARDFEKRFARLEERLSKESSDLREAVRRQFDSLENYIKQEFESLTERLKTEQTERVDAVQGLSQDMKGSAQAFERRVSQLDDQLARAQRDLRQQLLDQSKTLSEEIRQKHEEVSAALDRDSRELREDKAGRSALAALFTEMAMRLNNEFTIPSPEDLGGE
jgi:DNA repair exonuclease SbcCD ATPase subunit